MTKKSINRPDEPWRSIPTATVNLLRNPDQHAIWSYLMHRPPGWIPQEKQIREHFNIGGDRYRHAIRGLREAGLVWWETTRGNNGRITRHVMQIRGVPTARSSNTVAEQHCCLPDPLVKGSEESLVKGSEESLVNTKEKTHTPRASATLPAEEELTLTPPAPKKPKAPPLNFNAWPQRPDPEQWAEIMGLRKAKKARNTQRAIDQLGRQLHKAIAAGYTFEQCMDRWETKQWKGFEAVWMSEQSISGQPQAAPPIGPQAGTNDNEPPRTGPQPTQEEIEMSRRALKDLTNH